MICMTALTRRNRFRKMVDIHRSLSLLMKKHNWKFVATVFTVGVLIGFTGCATAPYNQGSATASALKSAANQTASVSTKITDALGALNTMAFASKGDLRDPYGKFTRAVKHLQTASKGLDTKMAAVQTQAIAYLKHWNQQSSRITSANLRSISQQQQNDVSTNLTAVNADYRAVTCSFTPLMSHLKSIKTFLNTDLTPEGLNAIKSQLNKTEAEAKLLRDSLQQLQSHLNALAKTMSPVMSGGAP